MMGKLSRTRLKILGVLNGFPDDRQRDMKHRLRTEPVYRTEVATSLAARFLKDEVLPSEAEVSRAKVTLETWFLAQ